MARINKIKSARPRNPLKNVPVSLQPANGHRVKVNTRGSKVQKLVSPVANEIVTKGL